MAGPNEIMAFRGLDRAHAPHLVLPTDGVAPLREELNLEARTGALVKRGGFRRVAAVVQPLGFSQWPNLLYRIDAPGRLDDVIVPPAPVDEGTDPPPPAPGNGGGTGPALDLEGDAIGGTDSGAVAPAADFEVPAGDDEPTPSVVPAVAGAVTPCVPFALALAGATADYAGAGLTVTVYAVDSATGAVSAVTLLDADTGEAANFAAGWASGVWAGSVYFPMTAADALWIGAQVGRVTHDCTAALTPLAFAVGLPGAVAPGTAFELTLTGPAGYLGAGASLTFLVEGQDPETEGWSTITELVKAAGGGAIGWTAGWSAGGAWREDVKLESEDYSGLRVSVKYGSAVLGTATADVPLTGMYSITVALPVEIEAGAAFDLTLTAKDRYGEVVTDFDGAGTTLVYEGLVAGGEWEAADALVKAAGGAVDPAAGWAAGVWTQSVKLAVNSGPWVQYRVTVKVGGGVRGYDVALLDVDESLGYAINERREAVGLSGFDPSGTYSLHDLRYFVNEAAPHYLADNDWGHGSAAAPEMLTNTYANSAASKLELYALVVVMRRTAHQARWGGGTEYEGIGEDAENEAAAIADARADYELVGTGPGTSGFMRVRLSYYEDPYEGPPGVWDAAAVADQVGYYVKDVSILSGLTKVIRCYGQCNKHPWVDTYSGLGLVDVDEGEYAEIGSEEFDADQASGGISTGVDSSSPPGADQWPAAAGSKGFIVENPRAVIDWDFVFVGISS